MAISIGCVIGDTIKGKSTFVDIAPYQICKGKDHMHQFLQDIIDGGGEGIILRDPLCSYQPGRSSGYLKHKVRNEYAHNVSELTLYHQTNRDTETLKPN